MNDSTYEARSRAARKGWETRRANARRRDYRTRGFRSWITRRTNEYYGTPEQSRLTERVMNELY